MNISAAIRKTIASRIRLMEKAEAEGRTRNVEQHKVRIAKLTMALMCPHNEGTKSFFLGGRQVYQCIRCRTKWVG